MLRKSNEKLKLPTYTSGGACSNDSVTWGWTWGEGGIFFSTVGAAFGGDLKRNGGKIE